MNKLRVIIADDERPAREHLRSVLAEIESVEIVGEADNGADAAALIKDVRPDLALLDLKMPEVSGLDTVRMLTRSQMPQVAFVTAHDEYAVEAFEVNAVDYLLKPVDVKRLAETIRRASERLEHDDWREANADRLSAATDTIETADRLTRIPVRHRDEITLVPVDEVASIVADGELLRITTAENQRYVINHRLKDLESRLDPDHFVRLSRGTLINLSMADTFSPMPGGTYLVRLSNGERHTSSRMQSKVLRARLLKL